MRRGLAAVVVFVAACGGGGGRVVAPPAGTGRATSAPAAPKARWFLNGYDDFHATAYVRAEEGELFFGPRGERLLRTGSQLRSAEELLPETIVSGQLRAGTLRLLGASGTLYEGKTALGTMKAKLSPFDGARASSASESALFVLDRAGKLHRSSDGQAWSDVTLPGLVGVATNVALAGTRGLVTAVPPQLFATTDEGATFQAIDGPPGGVSQIAVDRDDVLVRTSNGWSRFEPPNRFVASAAPGLWSPRWPARASVQRALDGGTAAELVRDGGRTLAVHPIGVAGAPHELVGIPESCIEPSLALGGGTVAIRCDEGATTTIFASTDDGKTFAPVAKLEGGRTRADHAALALGAGGALFVGERCKDAWSSECGPPVARSAVDGAFVSVPRGTTLAAAWDARRAGFVLVVTDTDRTRLVRTSSKGLEELGVLVPAPATAATIGVGSDGSVSLVVRSGEELAAFTTTTTAFAPIAIPSVHLKSGAMAGSYGLVVATSGRAFETVDGGSWHEVLAPAHTQAVLWCTAAGCLLDRGLRVGWDGAATASTRKPATKPALRCKPAGPRASIGSSGAPPRANALDHGPYRIVLPVRDGDGGVRALRSAWSDPPERFTSTDVLGPGQPYPAYGTRAVVLTQGGGVVAARYTWKRIHFSGTFNPVALDVAWLRDGETTSHHAAATLPAFRSSTEFLSDAIEAANLPEVLALGATGVHWRSPLTTGDLAIGRFFDERGQERKVPIALDVVGTRSLLSGDRDAPVLAADHDGDLTIADVTEKRSLVVLPGVDDTDRALAFATLGGKPVAIATHRRAGRSFAFPIATRGSSAAFELPTQRSLDGVPLCTATTAGDPVDLPWIDGARRPIRVIARGTERRFVTDRARVRVSGSAITCLTGFDAEAIDRTGATVLLLGDGTHALFVEMDTGSNAGGTVEPLVCGPDEGDLPLAFTDVPGIGD